MSEAQKYEKTVYKGENGKANKKKRSVQGAFGNEMKKQAEKGESFDRGRIVESMEMQAAVIKDAKKALVWQRRRNVELSSIRWVKMEEKLER